MLYYERYWKNETFDEQGLANTPPKRSDHEIDKIMDILRPHVSGCVLDVGSGDGFITDAISRLPDVMEVHGVDISNTVIDIAKSKYPQLDFKVAPVTDLPFVPNYFDVIVAIEVIEHILDTQQMFREFSRVLKDDGYLIITTTDFNLPKKVIIALFYWNRYFHPTNPHIRFFSKKSLETMLNQFGFRRVAHRWNGSYFGMMPKGQIMIAKKIKK